MKKIIYLFYLLPLFCFGQDKHTVSGYITDLNSGESIIGANIYCPEIKQGVTTNSYGFYSLTLPTGNYELSYSFIGYQTLAKQITLSASTRIDLQFVPSSIDLDEIELNAKANFIKSTQTSVIDIPVTQIKAIPAFLGEVDVLRAIQLLPGVQSSEGSTGFYVRGGGPDQNLILMDGVPVYNASHIGGLFSVFNADAINNVRLTKGGFPARFGGRLSSVLQIDMKEGNNKKFKGDVTLGLISSKITLEGPIIKDKTSFIFSGRRTYADLIARSFIPSNETFALYFYDFNAKINHKISDSDRIYLSAYSGSDVLSIESSGGASSKGDSEAGSNDQNFGFGMGYGNLTATIRWNHLFSDKLFANTTLAYSRYNFNTDFSLRSFIQDVEIYNQETNTTYSGNSNQELSYGYLSGIEDWSFGVNFDYMPHPKHDIKFGFSYTNHKFFPGAVDLLIDESYPDTSLNVSIDTLMDFSGTTRAHELFYYIEDDINFSNRLKANVGMHIGLYASDSQDNFISQLVDLDHYSFQPRISMRYLLNEDWAVKASYAQMQQNIHLLSNSSVGLPSDLWVPAIDSVPSQSSHQVAASLSTQMASGTYEVSLEAYYKTMRDLITYSAGYSNLSSTDTWQNAIETGGKGESYGMELFLQKKKGATTGWIGYTLSWTNRQFQNINFGNEYPYKYDRRHDISVVVSHTFSDRLDVGFTWVYGTGNATSFPQAVYLGLPSQGWNSQSISTMESYGNRNSVRMNPYHRLDFGINIHKQLKRHTRTLSLGAYNFYNRKNPFFVYLSQENNERVANQVSLFPFIPSISYRLKF